MRHLIYFSKSATTSGKALSQGNLMKAGRIDIAIHSFIQGIFLSNDFRKDVIFHFVFYGMPDPPKHCSISALYCASLSGLAKNIFCSISSNWLSSSPSIRPSTIAYSSLVSKFAEFGPNEDTRL